jgi:hypothetical protein
MPPRRALLGDDGDDQDFPMAGGAIPAAYDNRRDADAVIAGPTTLDFGTAPLLEIETLIQQLVRHWLNERHAPDILPVQAEVLGALLDHIRRQVCLCVNITLTAPLSLSFFYY